MTRRQLLLGAGVVIVLVGAAGLGFLLAQALPDPVPTPSPSPSVATCQVSVTPDTVVVDPDTGLSDDVVLLVGAGFPPDTEVTVDFPTGQGLDTTSSSDGDLSVEITPEPGVTHPSPPDLESGPISWVVAGPCEVDVEVTIEFTHQPSGTPSASPPTGLSAGDYAEVLADGVRVRVAPSPTATIVGALYSGDIVHILAPAQVAEGYAWYLIETAVIQSGQPLRGYMAAGANGVSYLRETAEPPPPTPTPSATPSASP